MKIIIFGGTGNVGQIIVKKLIADNKNVTVLTRQIKQSAFVNLHYIVGNVLEYSSVEKCIEDNDQIIISLGFNNSDLDTMSRGTKNVIEAMKQKNCSRLICLSSQGAGDSWNYMPGDFKTMVNNDPILRAAFQDHTRQEEIIKSTDLEWTIVRPTEIIDSEESGNFDINFPSEHATFQISKYDVAQFIVDELKDKKYLRQAVMITN